MAVIKAQASGNWSAVGTWSGGVVPSLNDTVYANGFTVALDQSIDLTGSIVDTSGSFIPGQIYMVVSLGTTNFALTANCIAPGTNAGTPVAIPSVVGQIFQAVNAGTATTGTARRMGALLNYVNTPLTIATGGGFTLAANWNITGAYIQAGSANCLTVSAAASSTLAGCRATGSAFNLSTRAIAFSSSGILTLNGIVAIGGRVVGTTPANGAHAIESTSAVGTIDITNASTLTGGNQTHTYGLSNASTGTITITSSTVTGGGGGSSFGLSNASTGTVTITSSTITGGFSGNNPNGINNASSGTITITSSTVTGGSGGSLPYGINNASSGTITITSSTVTGGSGTSSYGLSNASTGTITVTSSTLTGGSGTNAYGLSNASSGTIVSTGDITATNSASALSSDSTAASVKVSGSLIGSANGISAIYASKYLIDPTPTTAKFRQGKNGSTTYSDFFTADNSFGQAAITDVRFGTVYASGALTGVAYIPSAGSVALGVPVDATTGTATLTAQNVRDAIGLATANLDTQLAAIPTAAGNASAVRTELAPELAQVTEIHAIHGLDIANALTVTPTLRSAGAITQAITGDGTTSTIVTRV
jgi:hypothetical protein